MIAGINHIEHWSAQVTDDLIYKLDAEGFYVYANEATSLFLKTPLKELYSKSFKEFVRADWLDRVVDFYKEQVRNHESSTCFEFPVINGEGEEFWVRQTLEVVSDGYKIMELMAVARDITENVYAKNLLKSNEHKYREIIDNIDLGLMEVDLEEKIIFANESFCRTTGYELTELIGKNASEIFLSKNDPYQEKVLEHNLKRSRGLSSVYEMRVNKKNGEVVWLTISGTPVKNEKGQIVGSIGIHHNITERKQEELRRQDLLKQLEYRNKELQKKQSHLKAINGFVTNLIACHDIYAVVREITQNTVGQFGFTDCVVYLLDESKSILTQISAYGDKDQNGTIKNPIVIPMGKGIVGSVALSGKPEIVADTSVDSRYIIDDKPRLSELAVPIIADNEIIGVIDSEHADKAFFSQEHLDTLSTLSNLAATKIKNTLIQEKKRNAEFALKESEAKLRSVINSALDAVISIDERGKITEWNPQAEELFKYLRDEAIGQNLSDLIVPPSYREAHSKGMEHYRNTGEAKVLNKRIEIHGCNKFGEEFPIELSIVPIVKNGQRFFSAFIRDITLRKQAENDMKSALEKQKELNEMKSRFVSMTSHEFRTPLTTIQTNIDLLSFHMENEELSNRAKLDRNFGRISSEVKRLTDLMNDILMIGKIENGKIPFRLELNSLKTICQEVIDRSFDNLEDGRRIILEVYGDEKEYLIDDNIYTHIISNLLSNALKYSAGSDSPILRLNYLDNEVTIEVQDFGIGIPKEECDQLFNSFYRATNVDNIQGTGLGLTIVKEFVRLHNADISVNSVAGEGSCFTIIQPMLEGE